jgi:hypothetical protein
MEFIEHAKAFSAERDQKLATSAMGPVFSLTIRQSREPPEQVPFYPTPGQTCKGICTEDY